MDRPATAAELVPDAGPGAAPDPAPDAAAGVPVQVSRGDAPTSPAVQAASREAGETAAPRDLLRAPGELLAHATEVPAGLAFYPPENAYARWAAGFGATDEVALVVVDASPQGFRIGDETVGPDLLAGALALSPAIDGKPVVLIVPRHDTAQNPLQPRELRDLSETVRTGAQAIADQLRAPVEVDIPGVWITADGDEHTSYWPFGHASEPWITSPRPHDPPSSISMVVWPRV